MACTACCRYWPWFQSKICHCISQFCRKRSMVPARSCNASRVAQWKRAGPITQRSVDRNHALLKPFFHVLQAQFQPKSRVVYIIQYQICVWKWVCVYIKDGPRGHEFESTLRKTHISKHLTNICHPVGWHICHPIGWHIFHPRDTSVPNLLCVGTYVSLTCCV